MKVTDLYLLYSVLTLWVAEIIFRTEQQLWARFGYSCFLLVVVWMLLNQSQVEQGAVQK